LAIVLGLLVVESLAAESLIANGSFTELDARGMPVGWAAGGNPSMRKEGGNTWACVDKGSVLTQIVKLAPDIAKLKLSVRMRVNGVVLGNEGWKDARLALEFRDGAGKHLDPWPNSPHTVGTGDWIVYDRVLPVPAGAATFTMSCSMLGDSGTAEFDDVQLSVLRLRSQAKDDLPLPEGSDEPWNMAQAQKVSSATREQICINGLWRFRPMLEATTENVPADREGWGWFKVPGIWPHGWNGDAQTLWMSDLVEEKVKTASMDQAWYKRQIEVPAGWAGRRILVDFGMVQTHVRVFVDGKQAGEVWFPGGRLDVSDAVQPGKKQMLAVLLTARPLEKESTSFSAPERVVKTEAHVTLKGLTGDVFLVGEPRENVLGDVHVVTSTRESKITFDTKIALGAGKRRLKARVLDKGQVVKEFESEPFEAAQLQQGRHVFSAVWKDAKQWDLDATENMYEVVLTLKDADGKVLDESLPAAFGFREFWIDGRTFYLNGRPLHLRALFTTSISSAADKSCLTACERTCQQLKSLGFNSLITSNYSFAPGDVGYMDALFQATDRQGLCASFALPHCKDFNWKMDDPKQQERYRQLCEYLIRRVQNHPSIVLFCMNHNATGYFGDQNPMKIDGIYSPNFPATSYQAKNRRQAQNAAGIANSIDPTRPVYHHQSGNLGELYTVNCYLNWAPRQERSDWLEHWGTVGVKPLFFVEWGLPHISSWSSYRGPQFIWRCEAFQQIWDSEFAAAYLGQPAYRMTPTKIESMRHEEALFAAGKPFHWGTLIKHLQKQEENYLQVQALMCDDNWRSHRTWGISAMLPWDQEGIWRRVRAPKTESVTVANSLKDLQRPGISPDTLLPGGQEIHAFDPENFELTPLGRSFARWNQPLLGYIGGGPKRFTEKGHDFQPGEKIEKQLVVLNDSRREIACKWTCALEAAGVQRSGNITVKPGEKELAPISIELPRDMKPGEYKITASFDFGPAGRQDDSFTINVLPGAEKTGLSRTVALYDPKDTTKALLDDLGIKYQRVEASSDLKDFGLLIVGREALSPDGAMPILSGIARGLKVLILEQDDLVLTKRFGFRINIHGERLVFARSPKHPALDGISEAHLHDWRGAATLVPPNLTVDDVEMGDPKWKWCGFSNTRVWRCGNHGNVATVLIEKPDRGDFMPILDCSFDLQYSPLLEYVEGNGRIVFCQLDLTGRTEKEPAAQKLLSNLCKYLDGVAPSKPRKTLYAGAESGDAFKLLKAMGARFEPLGAQALDENSLVVVGPKHTAAAITAAVERGANVLCLGLGEPELKALFPGELKAKLAPTIPSIIERFDDPALVGISNAELHWRTLLDVTALEPGASGNEALRVIRRGRGTIVVCQAAPWMFDYAKKPYVRTTFRRNSFLISRLLANLGACFETAFSTAPATPDWYLQQPIAEDDPFRYYRW
jgi:hypothetical protein